MPIYEYRCTACGATFERITRDPSAEAACTACGETAHRTVSAPSAGATSDGQPSSGCTPRGGFT